MIGLGARQGLELYVRARRPDRLDRLIVRYRWASLRRTEPISAWGHHRGTPIDRWYIEAFLQRHAELVHGHVLEVKDDRYASRLGASRVTVLDIEPDNAHAAVVGDVVDPETLPVAEFDAAVVTQTLQYVSDPPAAVAHLVASLRPGGNLLLTTPVASRLAGSDDRWRWTARGMRTLLADYPEAEIRAAGNSLACRAFLAGLAAEDLTEQSLGVEDDQYPLVVTAVVPRR